MVVAPLRTLGPTVVSGPLMFEAPVRTLGPVEVRPGAVCAEEKREVDHGHTLH